MEAPCKNRDFAPKFCPSEPYIHTVISWGPLQFEYRAQKGKILVQNCNFCTEFPSDTQTFQEQNNLTKLHLFTWQYRREPRTSLVKSRFLEIFGTLNCRAPQSRITVRIQFFPFFQNDQISNNATNSICKLEYSEIKAMCEGQKEATIDGKKLTLLAPITSVHLSYFCFF